MLSDNDIARIGEKVAQQFQPMTVGVFGSYATGLARDKSDLDLFLIKQLGQKPLRREAVRRLLGSWLYTIDIHIFAPDTFERNAHQRLSFEWVIAQQARILYHTEVAPKHVPCLFERRPHG